MIVTHIDGRSEFLTDYKGLQRKRRVNGEYSLSFLLLKTERNEHSYPLAVEESLIEYDGQSYRIKGMSEKTIGLTPAKQIQADHIFFDLVDEFQYDTISGYKSLGVCVAHALSGTDYTFDIIDSFSTVEFENFGNDNSLALIQLILERFRAEVEIDGKHLTFKRQIGRITDIQFRFKHNIKTVEKHVDTSNLSTYIKGFGKDVTAEYTSPMANLYGIRHAPPVNDERYTTHSGLLERLQNDLQDTPNISFTLEAVELLKLGINTEQVVLGDQLFVIYEPLDIDINARIVEMVEYPEEPTSSQLTIANFRPNIVNNVADFQRTKDRIDGIFEGKEKLPFNVLDDAVQRSTKALQSAETELKFEDGILAIDPNNPDYLVLLNSNGIGISRNGGVTFTEAITADGFNLSAGAIGQLDANNINANTLSAITAILGDVEAGTLTGVTLQTKTGAEHILIQGSSIRTRSSNGNEIRYITQDPQDYPAIQFLEGTDLMARLRYVTGSDTLALESFGQAAITADKRIIINAFTSEIGLYSNTSVSGDFTVSGSKNASVLTSKGEVNVSAYETAEYYFGDIGRDEVINGSCTVEIESLFKETVNTHIDYEVFLTPYGKGLIYVDEMTPNNFTVKGDDIPFAYEIKAKRKGYETVRLESTHESEVESVVY